MSWLLVVYFIIMNIAGIAVCYMDKRRAVLHRWRIPEKTIFLIAIIGGSLGVLIGMYGFRHKTRHRKFTIGIPCIMIAQILLAVMIYWI